MALTAEAVRAALPGFLYQTKDGRTVRGERVSAVPEALREKGWRNVSNISDYELKQLGIEIVTATYVARPGRFVSVAVKEG